MTETQDMTAGVSKDAFPTHLRLKRWFLRTLIISLTACALVAVVALLLATFNETTARILFTLGGLALHSGLAMACAAWLERRVRPAYSLFGLIAFGVNFCALMVCIWWPDGLDAAGPRGLATTGALIGYYVLAVPCADLYGRQRRPILPLAGMTVCAAGLVMAFVCIWAEPVGDVTFAKATGVVGVVAFSLAHTCLLMRAPGGPALIQLLWGTVVCVWAVAAMWCATILLEPDEEFFYRAFGALGVLDACGSLSLLIAGKLKQIGKVERLASTSARVDIRCPRCAKAQVLDTGPSKCSACGLKITIEIEEPRCVKCDYLLWQLPSRCCPECGTAF